MKIGVNAIKTYNDLLAVGQDEKKRMDFVLAAINEHKSSDLYKTAVDAEMYYDGENPTINRYEKILYDIQGRAHVDMWTANHKIATSFFGFVVKQENGYLLGNGVTFKDDDTKERLGTKVKTFDSQVFEIGEEAIIGGVAYGFWNLDHVEVFTVKDFVPLYDEEDGTIKSAIGFWQIDDGKPLRVQLFELDGYTDYIRRNGEDMEILTPKRGYIVHTHGDAINRAEGTVTYQFENYPTFPVVPLMYSKKMKSEICGKRNTIDAVDISTSGMVNNVDEGNLIYWVLNNAGGMDDLDDQKFLDRIKTLHVVHTDDGVDAQPHSIEAPIEGTKTTVDALEARLHKDFMTFNPESLSGGNKTATEIEAAFANLDLKVDGFERQVTKFINGILALAGIDDEPSYTRNKLINTQEEMQTLMTAAPYLDSEYITTKALTIMGDPDMADEVLKRQAAENLERFGGNGTQEDDNEDSGSL